MTYLQKLTEARKAIIELIKPCMDKTLSEGCLVFKNNGIMKVKHNELYEGNNIICFTNGLLVTEIELLSDITSKVIGHYDITAVFKCIDTINKNICEYELYGEYILIKFNGYEKYKIPLKPLHLYTEKEDKDLLELLKELGPINNN